MTTGNTNDTTTEFPLRWVRRWTWRGRVWHAVEEDGSVWRSVYRHDGVYHNSHSGRRSISRTLAMRAVERDYAEKVMRAMAQDYETGEQIPGYVPYVPPYAPPSPSWPGTGTITYSGNTTSAPQTITSTTVEST